MTSATLMPPAATMAVRQPAAPGSDLPASNSPDKTQGLSQILHHSQEDVFPAFLTISLPRPELKVRAHRGKSTEVDWKTQVVDRQSV